jgi:hypothetical protein
MKFLKVTFLSASMLMLPAVASAQGVTASQGLEGTMSVVSRLVNGAVGLLITLAILVFFWGIIRYIFGGGGTAKSEGLKYMLYGIITIFVMVSIWGIVALLQNTFGVGGRQPVQFDPNVPSNMDPRNGAPKTNY